MAGGQASQGGEPQEQQPQEVKEDVNGQEEEQWVEVHGPNQSDWNDEPEVDHEPEVLVDEWADMRARMMRRMR